MAANPEEMSIQTLDATRIEQLRSVIADYGHEQLLWSSGYLAGMAAIHTEEIIPAAIEENAPAAASTWSIFYATETGNCRRLAEALAERGVAAGVSVETQDLRDYRAKSLSRVQHALFVIATHGVGEAPDGSEPFFDYWLSERAPRLEQLNYSILALGDSSYADFCEMGRVLDSRLQQLGARSIADRVNCDLDFEKPASAWSDELLEHAARLAEVADIPRPVHLKAVSAITRGVSRDHAAIVEVVENQKITGNGSSKDVRHIELDLGQSGLTYLPGDSLGVIPRNPPELVTCLLDALKIDSSEEVNLDGQTVALSQALTDKKEITVLSRPFVEAAAAEDRGLQAMLEDRSQLTRLLRSRQVIDIVCDSAKAWRAQEFVDALRNLTPRLYSIASSPDVNPGEAHLTVAVVKYREFDRWHWGAASNFLSGGSSSVPVYLEPNDHFRLPADDAVPIIMIGAGTGVAPYRAFVEHRLEHGHRGDNWLIYGDRNLTTDFLYQIEWLRYRKDGTLRRLDVAFSRDQSQKIYVQQRIRQQSRRIYDWLEQGAHIYLCGDAERMAVDVNNALLAVVENEGGLSQERAAEYLAELKAADRYQRDVY